MSPIYPLTAYGRTRLPLWALAVVLLASVAGAQTVALDPTFGTAGRASYSFSGGQNAMFGLALQPDGKAVAASWVSGDFAVLRIQQDGTLDPAFGASGVRRIGAGEAQDIVVHSDGTMFAAGRRSAQAAVVRLDANGNAVGGFGSSGVALLPAPPGSIGTGYAVAMSGQQVVVAGTYAFNGGSSPTSSAFIARLNANGSLDASFGSGGVYTFDSGGRRAEFRSVAVQPDGSAIAAGYIASATGEFFEPLIVRVTSSGQTDGAFGANGVFAAPTPEQGVVYAIRRASTGGLIASAVLGASFSFIRLTDAGQLDPAFGSGGYARLGPVDGFGEARRVAELPSGTFLAIGYRHPAPVEGVLSRTPSDLLVGQVDATGSPIPSPTGGLTALVHPEGDFFGFGLGVSAGNRATVVGLLGNVDVGFQPAAVRLTGFGTTTTEEGPGAIALAMEVYPNPTRGRFTLSLRLPESADVHVVALRPPRTGGRPAAQRAPPWRCDAHDRDGGHGPTGRRLRSPRDVWLTDAHAAARGHALSMKRGTSSGPEAWPPRAAGSSPHSLALGLRFLILLHLLVRDLLLIRGEQVEVEEGVEATDHLLLRGPLDLLP
jgi:uncharacterized delta-60 repeat protein